HQREIVLERTNGIVGKDVAYIFHDVLGVLGTSALHKEDAGLVSRANQLLKGSERDKKARPLAVLDDSCNMPVVLEDAIRLSRLHLFRFRGNVIHKNIVRALQVVPLKEYESARDGTKA